MVGILTNWDDPHLREQAQAFFALNYLENLDDASRREKGADSRSAKPIQDAAAGAEAQVDKCFKITLSVDNFPEEAVDQESVRALLALYHQARTEYARPLEEVDTPEGAACVLIERVLLKLAKAYLYRVVMFLAADQGYHPEWAVKIDAVMMLDFEADDTASLLKELPAFLALGNALFPDMPRNMAFSEPLAIFEHTVAIFFDILDQAFPLRAIGKCRRAYDNLFLKLGEKEAVDEIPNILRRHKTMYREILNFRQHGGQASAFAAEAVERHLTDMKESLTQVAAQTQETLTAIKGVDRRQRDIFAFVRKSVGGFVELFRPKPKLVEPSREAVAAALLPSRSQGDRYDCLQRITEPHRSQIKAVIDYTLEHPIVYQSKRKGDFTLADAAKAVFLQHGAIWEKIPGSFPAWQHLKSSCYNLQGKDDDPFNYQR